MHVILTHEQADFDALASLLGAHLLDEAALPILPRRINRNGRAFLTLYGADLPFVDPRDLSGQTVETVTLVDTQSLVSVKGMGPNTRVQVVDHHPPRSDLPSGWMVNTDTTGANATLFVEALQERNGALTRIQATMLLLGIYEDTGSLTYSRTTPRDIRAAAVLLELGADLGIVTDFLNHPLSINQQALYDQVHAAAETHMVNSHVVVVACGEAGDMEEEVSSVAHKLRDVLDPDGLVLLVETRGGVQLVARSTSEFVDAAGIAAHFGGGGHPRAAAGLIRERSMEDIHAELVSVLPDHVRPAMTVSEIMSHGLQTLSPDTPVQEADERMKRYGYEGYPVVEDGKVVGLLTRRAVDRAINHKLNVTAASLMRAGEVIAHPQDSIERLQKLMTDSGWGQIPVVDTQSGAIAGIVTRTDLLSTLTQEQKSPGRRNLAEKLESALPSARLALLQAVAASAHQQRAALYIVGGFTRDLILDRPSLDFDLVVEGDAIALARALSKQFGGRVTSHARFGAAKWWIGEEREALTAKLDGQSLDPADLPDTLDLVSARTEFYTHPTALPTVERGSIKLDLHRRDFTINTLALRLDGGHYGDLHDHWGGLADLESGLVRVLHSLSFVDDPTRMLRAVRFEQRFGFQIEDRTLQLLGEAQPLLDRVSGQRIHHELNYIFEEAQAPQMLSRLNELKLLSAISPHLTWDDWLQDRIPALPAAQPEAEWDLPSALGNFTQRHILAYAVWVMRLPESAVREISKRLKLSASLREVMLSASKLWQTLPSLVDAAPSQIAAALDEAPPLALYAVHFAADNKKSQEAIHTYLTRWKSITPAASGHDLRARGLAPGPAYKRILQSLRAAWLDGAVTDPKEEAALLDKLLDEAENPDSQT